MALKVYVPLRGAEAEKPITSHQNQGKVKSNTVHAGITQVAKYPFMRIDDKVYYHQFVLTASVSPFCCLPF